MISFLLFHRKLHQQFEMYKDQVKKIGDEAQKKPEQKADSPTCGICHKTKFADGCGHVCSYCQTKFCARCGGRVSLRSNKVRLACVSHHYVCRQSVIVCLSVCLSVSLSVCLFVSVVSCIKTLSMWSCVCVSCLKYHISQLWRDFMAFVHALFWSNIRNTTREKSCQMFTDWYHEDFKMLWYSSFNINCVSVQNGSKIIS